MNTQSLLLCFQLIQNLTNTIGKRNEASVIANTFFVFGSRIVIIDFYAIPLFVNSCITTSTPLTIPCFFKSSKRFRWKCRSRISLKISEAVCCNGCCNTMGIPPFSMKFKLKSYREFCFSLNTYCFALLSTMHIQLSRCNGLYAFHNECGTWKYLIRNVVKDISLPTNHLVQLKLDY